MQRTNDELHGYHCFLRLFKRKEKTNHHATRNTFSPWQNAPIQASASTATSIFSARRAHKIVAQRRVASCTAIRCMQAFQIGI